MAERISFKERLRQPWVRRRRKDKGSKVQETPLGVISSTPLPAVQEAVTVPAETATCTLPLRAPPSPDIQTTTPDDGGACTSLWDSAYDALKEEEPTYIAEYEALLSRVLEGQAVPFPSCFFLYTDAALQLETPKRLRTQTASRIRSRSMILSHAEQSCERSSPWGCSTWNRRKYE